MSEAAHPSNSPKPVIRKVGNSEVAGMHHSTQDFLDGVRKQLEVNHGVQVEMSTASWAFLGPERKGLARGAEALMRHATTTSPDYTGLAVLQVEAALDSGEPINNVLVVSNNPNHTQADVTDRARQLATYTNSLLEDLQSPLRLPTSAE
jgi:hypothetical protein